MIDFFISLIIPLFKASNFIGPLHIYVAAHSFVLGIGSIVGVYNGKFKTLQDCKAPVSKYETQSGNSETQNRSKTRL